MALEFGDGVWIDDPAGVETAGLFLGGPWMHEGQEVIWVCDIHEWDIAVFRQGRDPEGTAYPVASVRPMAEG